MSPAANVKKRAIKGSVISVGGVLFGQVLRLVSNVIMTHLLFPEAYGIMAIVTTVLIGLQLVSDLGTRVSIIQSEKGDDPDFLDTAWTLEILRGAGIFVAGSVLAIPIALIYNEPLYYYLIPVAASTALISSFNSSKLNLQVRNISLGRNMAIDLTANAAGLAAQIAYAYYFRSVWSLLASPIVASTLKMILSHTIIAGHKNRFIIHPEHKKAIIRTGKWVLISSAIMFFAQKVDVFLLGKIGGEHAQSELGIYNIAMVLALLPMTISGPTINGVLLPALSAAHRENHASLIESMAKARKVVLPIGLLAVLGMAIFAPPFFLILYDSRWHYAGRLTQTYMVIAWFQFLTEAFGRAIQAMDDARTLAIANSTRLIVGATGCVFGYWYGGLPGLMIGNALGAFAGYVVIEIALYRHQLADVTADLKFTLAGLVIGVADVATVHYVVAPRIHIPIQWVYVAVGLVFYLPVAAIGAKRVLSEIKNRPRPPAPSPPAPAQGDASPMPAIT